MGQHLSDVVMYHVTLRPLPLTLEVMVLVGDTGLRALSVYQV